MTKKLGVYAMQLQEKLEFAMASLRVELRKLEIPNIGIEVDFIDESIEIKQMVGYDYPGEIKRKKTQDKLSDQQLAGIWNLGFKRVWLTVLDLAGEVDTSQLISFKDGKVGFYGETSPRRDG